MGSRSRKRLGNQTTAGWYLLDYACRDSGSISGATRSSEAWSLKLGLYTQDNLELGLYAQDNLEQQSCDCPGHATGKQPAKHGSQT